MGRLLSLSLFFFFFFSLLLLLGVPVTAGLREQGGREAARAARIDGSDEAAASRLRLTGAYEPTRGKEG